MLDQYREDFVDLGGESYSFSREAGSDTLRSTSSANALYMTMKGAIFLYGNEDGSIKKNGKYAILRNETFKNCHKV
jgi:hypothetical protein